MSYTTRLATRSAALLAFIGAGGYGVFRLVTVYIIARYKQVVRSNTNPNYDPSDDFLPEPVKADEGFVCPGATLDGGPGIGYMKVARPKKIRVMNKYGPDANFAPPSMPASI